MEGLQKGAHGKADLFRVKHFYRKILSETTEWLKGNHSVHKKPIGFMWAVALAEPRLLHGTNATTHLLPWQPQQGLLSFTPADHFML